MLKNGKKLTNLPGHLISSIVQRLNNKTAAKLASTGKKIQLQNNLLERKKAKIRALYKSINNESWVYPSKKEMNAPGWREPTQKQIEATERKTKNQFMKLLKNMPVKHVNFGNISVINGLVEIGLYHNHKYITEWLNKKPSDWKAAVNRMNNNKYRSLYSNDVINNFIYKIEKKHNR